MLRVGDAGFKVCLHPMLDKGSVDLVQHRKQRYRAIIAWEGGATFFVERDNHSVVPVLWDRCRSPALVEHFQEDAQALVVELE